MQRRSERVSSARPRPPQHEAALPVRRLQRTANSANVLRRKQALLDLIRDVEPLRRHREGQCLSGCKIALPHFGIQLVVDSQAKEYCCDAKAARPPTAAHAATLPPPPRLPTAAKCAVQVPLVQSRQLDEWRRQAQAFNAVPQAVMAQTPYLQHLRAKAAERAGLDDGDAQQLAPREADLFGAFQRVVGEARMDPAARGGTIGDDAMRHAFELWLVTGDEVGVRELLLGAMQPKGSGEAPAQAAPPAVEGAAGAQQMDDVPAPSGLPCDPWTRPPKLRMRVAEKMQHLDALLKRSVTDDEGSCTRRANPQIKTPESRVDVVGRTTAQAALDQFSAFHQQQSELAAVRRANRHAAHNANLHRKHSAKLARPLLQRRTIDEDDLCAQE